MRSIDQLKPLEVGLCSWCLHVDGADIAAFEKVMAGFGLRALHFALGPIARLPAAEQEQAIARLRQSPLAITCGMIGYQGENYSSLETIHRTGGLVPDADFDARFKHTIACGQVGQRLGLTRISSHAGFIPDASDQAAFDKMQQRIGRVADEFARLGLSLLFETGQESAPVLLAFLQALGRKNVGVNFDPANMILYGKGDPVAAVRMLAPYVQHVHAKDARRLVPEPADKTAWRGQEMPLGAGDADLEGVIGALRDAGYRGPLIIEREAGEDRETDIRTGIAFLRGAIGG